MMTNAEEWMEFRFNEGEKKIISLTKSTFVRFLTPLFVKEVYLNSGEWCATFRKTEDKPIFTLEKVPG